MSNEASHLQRPSSPVSSGRSSPIYPRPRGAADDGSNRKDKNYRRYASGVERALSSFDTALQEWADYISFLGRLLKALQTRPNGNSDIPHKSVVAKRLAQCLNPTLPSGVHQKTLEVYAYIFSVLSKDGLRRDLLLYLPGLSPTLSFASLSVKPSLLSLFETFILALDPVALRPALKAILLALLPGLEEETSEEFERTYSIINKFKDVSGRGSKQNVSIVDISRDQYFWQCFFLASITSSSRRQGALSYLVRDLPNLGAPLDSNPESTHLDRRESDAIGREVLSPAMEAVTSPEPGLLIRCFATGLRDEHLLIQRGFLDLLVTHLPLHAAVLQVKVSSVDLERLIAAAASVVARREMSLNRRLWTWFLGPETSIQTNNSAPNSSNLEDNKNSDMNLQRTQSDYFKRYGLDALVSSIQKMLDGESLTPAEKARPFRICLSLMDRWEIGSLIVPRVFLTALESVCQYQKDAQSKESFTEVLRSANVFFDGVETGLIWGELTKVITLALQVDEFSIQHAQSRLDLVLFIITKFNVREEEMLLLHIPITTALLLVCVRNNQRQPSIWSNETYSDLFRRALVVCSHLVDFMPERAFSVERFKNDTSIWKAPGNDSDSQNQQLLNSITKFYEQHHGSLETSPPPISAQHLGSFLLDNAVQLVIHDLDPIGRVENIEVELSILEKLVRKVPNTENLNWEKCLSILAESSKRLSTENENNYMIKIISAIVSALEIIQLALPLSAWQSDYRVRQIIPSLISNLWFHLSPSRPQYNVEAARCILRIRRISPEKQLVEGSITALMARVSTNNRECCTDVEAARRFITLWAHSVSTLLNGPPSSPRTAIKRNKPRDQAGSEIALLARPLLLLLDSLFDSKTEVFFFTSNWLGSLPNMQMIIDFLLQRLQGLGFPSQSADAEDLDDTSHNADEILYYLQTISNLVECSKNNVWSSLTSNITASNVSAHQSNDQNYLAEETKDLSTDHESSLTAQIRLSRICLDIFRRHKQGQGGFNYQSSSLCRAAALLLQRLLVGLSSSFVLEDGLENSVIETLSWSIKHPDVLLQIHLMNLVLVVLRVRPANEEKIPAPTYLRTMSRETVRGMARHSLPTERNEKDQAVQAISPPPPALLDCLMSGLSSPTAHPVLEHWVGFLNDCLPFYADSGSQILMPLVDCFIKSLESVFEDMQASFEESRAGPLAALEPTTTLITLLNGLERALASAHDQLTQSDPGVVIAKSPDQAQGFFGNMVSGVFAPEAQRSRIMTANNRLTVLLCFKDAVRLGLKVWSWGDSRVDVPQRAVPMSASFNYTSLRMKNRTRRILEHLFAAEALECLETLVESWCKPDADGVVAQPSTVFNLLHALDGSRPRNTIPAIFNAIYSRTNPNALDPIRKSTLTSDLSDVSLAAFLIAYTRSLEDDAMDEIWTDCMTFLKDVLANPLPHRQTLPKLLEFTATLGEKVDNTNFGEQRRMRRDLGDLFVRILAATFTTKPLGFSTDSSPAFGAEKTSSDSLQNLDIRKTLFADDVVAIIASITPNLSKILIDADRITAAATTISTQVLTPTFRWKSYPQNVTQSTLKILYGMSRIPEASKTWRKDVAEAFNDSKFFCASSLSLAEHGWLPILRQWALLDKDRMPEILARLSTPTSAGIMFGVGASSARLEADRKTQLNLRRIVILILASAEDAFAVNLSGIQERLVELLAATPASSPSSTTRPEIFILFRALVLKISPVHMSSFWPIINSELYEAISSLFSDGSRDTYNIHCVVQACKLLETLLIMAPDDFQMREWLFVTDTIDAVYRPTDWDPIALVDELAEDLDSKASVSNSATTPLISATHSGARKPLLTSSTVRGIPKEDLVTHVLRPFFRQLSISSFESMYSMEAPDWRACYDDLLVDTFDDNTIV